ncbi:MAG: hypothetical protein Q9218_007804, partial [Villophora microphyllina]
ASSSTYAFDRVLNIYDLAMDDLSHRYREHGHFLTEDQRPDPTETSDRLSKIETEPMGDQELQAVRNRWELFGCLRKAYVALLCDFDTSHCGENNVVQAMSDINRCPDDHTTHALNREAYTLRRFDEDFKGRFHRAVCLHSIAMAARKYGNRARWPDMRLQRQVWRTAVRAWCRSSYYPLNWIGFHDGSTQQRVAIDGLEVYDFLYHYLMPALLPVHVMCPGVITNNNPPLSPILVQEAYLQACRHHVRPQDLAKILHSETWKHNWHYPADKRAWADQLGMAEAGRGQFGGLNWWTAFSRSSILQSVGAIACRPGQFETFDEHRRRLGSPFVATHDVPARSRRDSLPARIPIPGESIKEMGEGGYETD